MNEYLQLVSPNPSAASAIILIPDIWGVTDYCMETANSLASKYQRPVYVLDYFYVLTNKPSKFNLGNDGATAPALMSQMKGSDFTKIFDMAINEIQKAQPALTSVQVVGFCFGGRLAYLTGANKLVNKIAVFYGAGANDTGFYDGQSVIDVLVSSRSHDPSLRVLSFFGSQDNSIPTSDQELIQQKLEGAGIAYQHREYPAGHAYFQKGRPSYDQQSAEKSWEDLDKFLA